MGRSRVLSFMSHFSGHRDSNRDRSRSGSVSNNGSNGTNTKDSNSHNKPQALGGYAVPPSESSGQSFSQRQAVAAATAALQGSRSSPHLPLPPASASSSRGAISSRTQSPNPTISRRPVPSPSPQPPHQSEGPLQSLQPSQLGEEQRRQQWQQQQRQQKQQQQEWSNQPPVKFPAAHPGAPSPTPPQAQATESAIPGSGHEDSTAVTSSQPPPQSSSTWQQGVEDLPRDTHSRQQQPQHQEESRLHLPTITRSRSRSQPHPAHFVSHAPSSRSLRPLSMVQTYQPPLMDINEDTIPELQPVFAFLNSHANKLYQEGYFLKLDDQNIQGRPNADRTWTECFAQLVGTVLSLWDAAELDAAGEDGEVLPKFINLTDASIQMIESLPTTTGNTSQQPLQNILSVSTAGRNRYLLHFNSHHSLLQWTAGIRLAMYEQATLQEAYTGALIAGRGKTLNNINLIMDRNHQKTETWARVRFGAGTPWRRCWCVITPPDEKQYQKALKDYRKRFPYDRTGGPILKGDLKFFDTKISLKKQRKVKPLAVMTDSYSAYAIYPQAKSLIDASTLIKVEGKITYFLDPPSSKEGFVFVMPEAPPAVSGFEMLLRFLFPIWDTFALYGRPGRLVASVLDQRSLMFAMPKHKRYGYLEVLDVTNLISTQGATPWGECEWRRKMKELTSQRMTTVEDSSSSKTHSRSGSKYSNRLSTGPAGPSGTPRPRVNFADGGSVRSGRSATVSQAGVRTDSAPAANRDQVHGHSRNASDPHAAGIIPQNVLGYDNDLSPPDSPVRGPTPSRGFRNELASTPENHRSDEERLDRITPIRELEHDARDLSTPEPVTAPPAFAHAPASKPSGRPYHSPEMRKANTRLSHATLAHMVSPGAGSGPADSGARNDGASWDIDESPESGLRNSDRRAPVVQPVAHPDSMMMANGSGSREVLAVPPQKGPPRSKSALSRSRLAEPSEEVEVKAQHPSQQSQPSQQYSPAQAVTTDSPSQHSQPGSDYSSSLESQKPSVPAFHRPFTPPTASPSKPVISDIQTDHFMARKPLPGRNPSTNSIFATDDASSISQHSLGSLAGLALDPTALDKIRSPESGRPGTAEPHPLSRHGTEKSGASSHYDDASTTSPDYASTIHSEDTKAELVDRPRVGVLRTVGDAVQAAPPSNTASNVPEINFGPTYDLTRPSGSHSKSPSQGSLGPIGGASFRPYSPGQKTPTGQKTPPGEAGGHGRQASDDTVRRVAWQAGASAVGATSSTRDRAISPADFVQQRASNTPLHHAPPSHQRRPSGNTLIALRAGTPTPPAKTPPANRSTPGQDAVHRPSHSRSQSIDLLHRPASRGAASALTVGAGLSAREQERVSQMTGASLVQLGDRRPEPQRVGLVGAIAQREKEKEQVRQGYGNQAVQQAIQNQKRQQHFAQQHFAQQQAQAQAQQQHPYQQQAFQQQMFQQQGFQAQQQQQQRIMYGMGNASSPSLLSVGGQGQQQQYGGSQYGGGNGMWGAGGVQRPGTASGIGVMVNSQGGRVSGAGGVYTPPGLGQGQGQGQDGGRGYFT